MIRAYGLKELQESLRVSRSTLLRWMTRHDSRTRLHRIEGTSRVLVAESEVVRWLKENSAQP